MDGDDEENEIHAIDHGFGHNTISGRQSYGRLPYSDLPNLTSEVISLRQAGCQNFHQWLIMGGCVSKQPNGPTSEVLALSDITENIGTILKATASYPSKDILADLIWDKIHKTFKTDARAIIQAVLDDTLPKAILAIPWESLLKSCNHTAPPESSIIVQLTTLQAVRHLFQQPRAQFKSIFQARILELVSLAEKHVIGILPTGGGKCDFFYAYFPRSRRNYGRDHSIQCSSARPHF